MKLDIVGFLAKQAAQVKEKEEKVKTLPSNGPGPGKKQCGKCLNYVGVRSQVCKFCNHVLAKPVIQQELLIPEIKIEEFVIPQNPVYVYEHLRLDTWEKEQAEKIIANKDSLSDGKERFFAPTGWRVPCKTIDEVLNRTGIPWRVTLKDDLARIIVKCIPTNNFKTASNHRLGQLQEMIIVELIEV